MTCATTRSTTPAATPRTGRFAAALPNDPGLDDILADPNLSSTAKMILISMVKHWARYKDHCWPTDETLAKKVGKSIGHVQRCLHELERAGRIFREKTDEVPNGRRIWLLWRCTGDRAGARRDPAPARTPPTAPARSERVVIVNEGTEPEIRPASRRRSEDDPVPTATLDAPPTSASTSRTEELPKPREPLLTAQEARETLPGPVPEAILTATGQALPGASGGLLDDPAPAVVPSVPLAAPLPLDLVQEAHETLSKPVTGPILTATGQALPGASGGLLDDPAPAVVPSVPLAAPLPLDLGAIGKSMARSSMQPTAPGATTPSPSATTPPAPSAPRCGFRHKGLGLDLTELVNVVGETADPILAAELARRTAPPGPPEPPPQTLPTAELFELLPGRHDLIAAATHRLAEATGDFKVVSWKFFQQAVLAVVTRSVPPEVLLDCHRQATGPTAKNRGSVFVVAWQREVLRRC